MGVRESLLNTITSVGSSDFVRVVTSAGASSKATLQNVIKSFETGLGAKSNLSTSDYIRVVGSDNNLYKQSVSDVADLLNNNMPIPQFSASGFADLETKLSSFSGRYIASVTGTDGASVGLNTWTVIGFKNSTGSNYTYGFQYAFSFDDAPYVRYRRNSTTWGAWQKMPNRTEVDALKNNTVNTTFASSDTSKYTLNNNVRLVRRGSVYILVGEVKCISPTTSSEVSIVSGNMVSVVAGQTFVPAWGAGNASKDALGVHFGDQGIFLSYGTAGCYYNFAIPMFG